MYIPSSTPYTKHEANENLKSKYEVYDHTARFDITTFSLYGSSVDCCCSYCSPVLQRGYKKIRKSRYSFGSRGSGRDQFDRPWGLASNKAGDLIICDCNNHRIKVTELTVQCYPTSTVCM